MTLAVGVLVPVDPAFPAPPPESRPIGRAALWLADRGLTVVFGDLVRGGLATGVVAVAGGWRPVVDREVCAYIDRYPSASRAGHYERLRGGLCGVPMANTALFTRLCRDKLSCQRALEEAGVPLPEVEGNPEAFETKLEAWGAGFLKPRYGSFGAGVRRVEPGDPLPSALPGPVPGVLEPAILQKAVAPPSGWAGWSVRVLAQRDPDDGWVYGEPVVRRSREDPVVNAARGADVLAGSDALSPETLRSIRARTEQAAEALATSLEAIEMGVDLVLDGDGQPHLVEVNSRPRGRIEVLAQRDPDRFAQPHAEACARPLRWMARRHGGWR